MKRKFSDIYNNLSIRKFQYIESKRKRRKCSPFEYNYNYKFTFNPQLTLKLLKNVPENNEHQQSKIENDCDEILLSFDTLSLSSEDKYEDESSHKNVINREAIEEYKNLKLNNEIPENLKKLDKILQDTNLNINELSFTDQTQEDKKCRRSNRIKKQTIFYKPSNKIVSKKKKIYKNKMNNKFYLTKQNIRISNLYFTLNKSKINLDINTHFHIRNTIKRNIFFNNNSYCLHCIIYIIIVKVNNSFRFKVGSTQTLHSDETKREKSAFYENIKHNDGKYYTVDRFNDHKNNFNGEKYPYIAIGTSDTNNVFIDRRQEEDFHDKMKKEYNHLVVKNALNNKNSSIKEIYELSPKVIDIFLDFFKIDKNTIFNR